MCGLLYVKLSPEFNYYIIPVLHELLLHFGIEIFRPQKLISLILMTPELESDCCISTTVIVILGRCFRGNIKNQFSVIYIMFTSLEHIYLQQAPVKPA